MSKPVSILLRAALAFAFLYPAVSAIFDPYSWVGYFPSFLRDLPVSDMVMLQAFGVFETVLALWILSGKKIFIPSSLCAVVLALIILFNWPLMDVIFRDVSIMFIAVALAVDVYFEKG